jgi:branched-chain amino acid aminotransferase
MAVFESLRVTGGEAEFFDKHLQRLLQACAERAIPCDESVLVAVAEVWRANSANGFARIYVTAGDGGPADSVTAARVYILLEARTPPDPDNPWELTLCEETHRPAFPGLKTANYWFHCAALAHARQRGFDESLLFNERAELVSASMANVFVLRDERLCTPPRSSGCRTGVIREWVIARRKVEERRLFREDVLRADEIFLTNSWIGVMPVATLEGRPLGPRSIGPRLAAELANRRSEV